jgi:broad specificity phosphatase PhoE
VTCIGAGGCVFPARASSSYGARLRSLGQYVRWRRVTGEQGVAGLRASRRRSEHRRGPVSPVGVVGHDVEDVQACWKTSGPFFTRPLGGESLAQVCERVQAFLQKVARTMAGKRVLIVSHAGTMWCMRSVLEGWTHEEADRLSTRKRCQTAR